MDAATTLPYSTANTKGQCIRHPTIQLKQKKTFGSGYKTITSICPMCAMELMSIEGNDQDDDCGGRGHVEVVSSSTSVTGWDASSIQASAQRSSSRSTHQQQHHRSSRSRHSKQRSDDVSIKSAPSTYNRDPRHHHRQQQQHHESFTNIESTSSFGHSSRSCGSHHRQRPTPSNNKQYYSHEIPSCDNSTLDMSLSVSSRSLESRSSSSQGGGSSRRSTSSSSSAASYTSSHSDQSRKSNNNNSHHPQQEEYVCGLQYNNGYYTGQIDIGTQLPHGLGSLRDRHGVVCNEGQWHYGRLVESTLPSSSRGSTNTSSYDPRQHAYARQQQEKKTNNFEQYIVSSSEEDESSSASTVHTDDEDSSIPSVALSSQSSSSSSSWTSTSRHSSSSSSNTTTRRLHSPSSPKYSARESKNTTLSLVSQDKFRSFSRTSTQARMSPQAATGNQVAHNKLQEYQNYIDMCDDNEDWYLENQEHAGKSRRVRFREDP